MPRRLHVALATLVLAGAAGAAMAAVGPIGALAERGAYPVGHSMQLLVDPARSGEGWSAQGRPIPVYVFYPAAPGATGAPAVYPLDPYYGFGPNTTSPDWEPYGVDPVLEAPAAAPSGPFPLVMFSPGWGAPAWMHLAFAARVASHGFVVAVLSHYRDGAIPFEPWDPIAVALYNRPRDVSFALTQLLAWNDTPGHLLKGLIRADQVAAAGWSLGGYAAMALAAGDDLVCDTPPELGFTDTPDWTCVPTPPDPRIKAIVPLDGSNQCLRWHELARINVPVLGMGEEWNAVTDWQARQHAAFSSHPAYRVDVANTSHMQFSGMCEAYSVLHDLALIGDGDQEWIQQNLCLPFQPASVMHALLPKYAIAFLRTNLQSLTNYQPILTPGWALARETQIEFFVTEKKSAVSIDQEWPDVFVYFKHQPGSAQARGPKDPKALRPVPHVGLLR